MFGYESWHLDGEDYSYEEVLENIAYQTFFKKALDEDTSDNTSLKRHNIGDFLLYKMPDAGGLGWLGCWFRGYEQLNDKEVALVQSEFQDIGVFYSPLSLLFYMEDCYLTQ